MRGGAANGPLAPGMSPGADLPRTRALLKSLAAAG